MLLTRDDIGRGKPTTHDLPQPNHTYGVKNKKEEYDVGKLTSSWHLPPLTEPKIGVKDYQKLNRMGAEAKVIKPYQVRPFRQQHDVRVIKKPTDRALGRVSSLRSFATQVVNPDPTVAAKMNIYGKANRAQTPVKGIITGSYGEDAEAYYRKRSEETF